MSFEIFGLDEFIGALVRVEGDVDTGSKRGVVRAAAEIEKKAKENASGAPGPEVVRGTLRRGIRHTAAHREKGLEWQTEVGPTVVYSRRIDLGFHGEDALGRVYNQDARPYFTPAWDETSGRLVQIYFEEWRKALTGL